MKINIINSINRIKTNNCVIISMDSYWQDSTLVAMKEKPYPHLQRKATNIATVSSQESEWLPWWLRAQCHVSAEWELLPTASSEDERSSERPSAPSHDVSWISSLQATERRLSELHWLLTGTLRFLQCGQLPTEQGSKRDWAPRRKFQSFCKLSFNLRSMPHHFCCIPFPGVGQEVHPTAKEESSHSSKPGREVCELPQRLPATTSTCRKPELMALTLRFTAE